MRLFVTAALTTLLSPAALLIPALMVPGMAQAEPQLSALQAPAVAAAEANGPQPGDSVRVAMRQQTLAPGAKLAEHRQAGERYLYVVAGRLKVSDLVTGEEQVVEPGKMAAEQPGDWHEAMAVGAEPATFYVIDRGPAETATARAGGAGR
jgi:quercetin dioxygenase-like cupin family protein